MDYRSIDLKVRISICRGEHYNQKDQWNLAILTFFLPRAAILDGTAFLCF